MQHTLIEDYKKNFKNLSFVYAKPKDVSYHEDSESCSSSNQSYYSSSQHTLMCISNDKTNYQCNKDGILKLELKPTNLTNKPIMYYSNGNNYMSEVTTEENMNENTNVKICRFETSEVPKKTSYGSSMINSSKDINLYPDEKVKTLIAAILSLFGFIATVTSLVLTHERLPDRNQYGPLPDIVLDNLRPFDWALDFSEYIIVFSLNTVLLILLFHRHRFIVFRRFFLIMAVLYLYRAFTMYVTVLPIPSNTYRCDPKMEYMSFSNIVKRIYKITSGFGLSINGKHVYCGDYIYSGHTVSLLISYLLIAEYTSEKYWFIHWVYWFLAALGIIFLQFAHGHYTIDILVAYYVTTRVFWTYHSLANNIDFKEKTLRNYFSRAWWFKIFQYFEKNVGGVVPNEYDLPFWCPCGLYEEE